MPRQNRYPGGEHPTESQEGFHDRRGAVLGRMACLTWLVFLVAEISGEGVGRIDRISP